VDTAVPNARVVISTAELASVDASPATLGAPALGELVEQGAVDGTEPPVEIAPGVVMELTGGHTPGHCVIRIADGAVFVGHLAVNPVQVSGGSCRASTRSRSPPSPRWRPS